MNQPEAALARAKMIDEACDRFETAWRAGQSPKIDDFVARVTPNEQESLRAALQSIEKELKGQSGVDTSVSQGGLLTSKSSESDHTAMYAPPKEAPKRIGRFEIRGVLGAGAFGKIYRGYDAHLGRDVAIKVPLAAGMKTEQDKVRFRKEAQAAATINHPNVCQIYEVGEFEKMPYIVMPVIPGQSLAEAIRSRKEPLPEKQIALIVRKIASALAAAHEKGIIHRDLKPGNVMFDRERKDMIVMDFGLARGPMLGEARATQSGVILGTPAYMSPEQASGGSKDVGPAADIFSLGVILYELLTGARPFNGTATEVIGQILHVEPKPPSARRPGINPELEAICKKAMAKEPANRYRTMKELIAALDAATKSFGGSQETAKATRTIQEAKDSNSDNQKLADVFAVLSAERKATAAALEQAVAKHRVPRWMLVALGVILLLGFTSLGGMFYFTRGDTVQVTLNLQGIDLTDQTLSFFLDGQPISAEEAAKPLNLAPGEHVFEVKRGESVVKRIVVTVPKQGEGGEVTQTPTNVADTWISPTTGMKLVRIPKGTFMMGSPAAEEKAEWQKGKEPRHSVTIESDFYMGVYEVTRGQFARFVADTGYKTSAEVSGGAPVYEKNNALSALKPGLHWQNPGFEQTDEHPVIDVSWNDAVKFAEWLSQKDGRRYRLPKEAEWEYACRAGSTTRFFFGEEATDLGQYGNLAQKTTHDDFPFTAPVGKFKPNAFGLYDTIGNVSEWFEEFHFKDPDHPDTLGDRSMRGSAWPGEFNSSRSAFRRENGVKPQHRRPDVGFRLVMEEGEAGDFVLWQGTWKCVTENSWGKMIYENDRTGKGPTQTISGTTRQLDKVSAGNLKSVGVSQFRIDESVSPKTFDCDEFLFDGKKYRQRGIYEFSGARLRVVYRYAQDHEPARATWVDIGKSDVHYYEFERVREGKQNKLADGWIPLFNGKDLTGWKTHPDQPGGWTVENGLLTGKCSSGEKPHHLFSERGDYRNFHLRAECKTNRFGNGGVFFRSIFGLNRPPQNPVYPSGYEAQIIHEFPQLGYAMTGSLLGRPNRLATVERSDLKPDEWFTLEVIAQGKRIIVKIDGKETANVEDDAFSSGYIALQAMSDQATQANTVVQFRKIEIREIAEAAPSEEKSGGLFGAAPRRRAVDQSAPTPAGATSFNGHHYRFFPNQLTWKDAKAECEALGGHLIVIDSAEENAFAAKLIENAGWVDSWIGITDEANEGDWRTVEGKKLTYTNWFKRQNQPNNKSAGKHFGLMSTKKLASGIVIGWEWSDQPNAALETHRPGYLCEWDR